MDEQQTNLTNDNVQADVSSVTNGNLVQFDDMKKAIIGNPYREENGTCLYTQEQIEQMFSIGAESATFKRHKKTNNTYFQIRNMNKGDVLYFPFDQWNAARSASCQLKKVFGGKYKVNKDGVVGEPGRIRVIRLQ